MDSFYPQVTGVGTEGIQMIRPLLGSAVEGFESTLNTARAVARESDITYKIESCDS